MSDATKRLTAEWEDLARRAIETGQAIGAIGARILLGEIDALRADLKRCWCRAIPPGSDWGKVCDSLAQEMDDARRWAVRLEQENAEAQKIAYKLLRERYGGLIEPFLPSDPTPSVPDGEPIPGRVVVVARIKIVNWTEHAGAIDCELLVDQEDLGDLTGLLQASPGRLFITGSYDADS